MSHCARNDTPFYANMAHANSGRTRKTLCSRPQTIWPTLRPPAKIRRHTCINVSGVRGSLSHVFVCVCWTMSYKHLIKKKFFQIHFWVGRIYIYLQILHLIRPANGKRQITLSWWFPRLNTQCARQGECVRKDILSKLLLHNQAHLYSYCNTVFVVALCLMSVLRGCTFQRMAKIGVHTLCTVLDIK